MKVKNIMILGCLFLLSACATIMDGETQILNIQSSPSGATVTINGQAVGVTPLTIPVTRMDNSVMKISLEGYNTQEIDMTTKLNQMFWGNFIFGGLFGSTTDSVTGASIEYSPNHFNIQLEKKS
ncbi:MAG: PEGA domain-containing protein [Gammaproteobacteria bacterium]|nr:PEGA domain-containing protein [Gammaproteobacteria bacterium]MDH5628791.1 PEGA domain-containing protein [Gammaproteobacteria bacterium]